MKYIGLVEELILAYKNGMANVKNKPLQTLSPSIFERFLINTLPKGCTSQTRQK